MCSIIRIYRGRNWGSACEISNIRVADKAGLYLHLERSDLRGLYKLTILTVKFWFDRVYPSFLFELLVFICWCLLLVLSDPLLALLLSWKTVLSWLLPLFFGLQLGLHNVRLKQGMGSRWEEVGWGCLFPQLSLCWVLYWRLQLLSGSPLRAAPLSGFK